MEKRRPCITLLRPLAPGPFSIRPRVRLPSGPMLDLPSGDDRGKHNKNERRLQGAPHENAAPAR